MFPYRGGSSRNLNDATPTPLKSFPELELELIQSHMAQKPVLRVEVGALALRVRSVSREGAWASASVQGAWVKFLTHLATTSSQGTGRPARDPVLLRRTRQFLCQSNLSQVKNCSPGYTGQATNRSHEASPQSRLGAGWKLRSDSRKLRGLGVRAQ